MLHCNSRKCKKCLKTVSPPPERSSAYREPRKGWARLICPHRPDVDFLWTCSAASDGSSCQCLNHITNIHPSKPTLPCLLEIYHHGHTALNVRRRGLITQDRFLQNGSSTFDGAEEVFTPPSCLDEGPVGFPARCAGIEFLCQASGASRILLKDQQEKIRMGLNNHVCHPGPPSAWRRGELYKLGACGLTGGSLPSYKDSRRGRGKL